MKRHFKRLINSVKYKKDIFRCIQKLIKMEKISENLIKLTQLHFFSKILVTLIKLNIRDHTSIKLRTDQHLEVDF